MVHSWAVTKWLSGELTDVLEAVVRQTLERIVALQVAPLKEAVSLILDRLTSPSAPGQVTRAEQTRGSKNGNRAVESYNPDSSSQRQLHLWQMQ